MERVRRNLGLIFCALMVLPASAFGQAQQPDESGTLGPANTLYAQLRDVGLDPSRVYHVRDASLDRSALHITLTDGTIAFTHDVEGKVTGAFFEGEGEVLLAPPNRVERASMALFTGGAILEETFLSAYFRFNDETFAQLQPNLGAAENGPEFIAQWGEAARSLAQLDALRLFLSFARFLPPAVPPDALKSAGVDSFLRARIQGRKLGTFDIYFDTQSPEQLRVSQLRTVGEQSYYDTWTSFAVSQSGKPPDDLTSDTGDGAGADPVHIVNYKIRVEVRPPTELKADAELQIEAREGGQRTLFFELSRFLKVDRVEADGAAIEFIHNPALKGSRLEARGDDLMAVVFPKPLAPGQRVRLHFFYGGAVLSDAGGGLLRVGDRGTWYPNRGLNNADYDLKFRYPAGWNLVATGKPLQVDAADQGPVGDQVAHWVSERPIPVAGFNLGKYTRAQAHTGTVPVDVYAARGVEKTFPRGEAADAERGEAPMAMIAPSPARNAQPVADLAASAIDFFSHRFGPYPYGSLAIAQMPGEVSQGWPGLIFLSSFSFLTDEERQDLHMSGATRIIGKYVLVHETAHQWWGDTVGWAGYRDQWMVEALANYSALMLLESRDPDQFRMVMEKFRKDLLATNQEGLPLSADGPVTLGARLSNSQFPAGYEAISYERGTWLLHMLRCMMRDAERNTTGGLRHNSDAEEPFERALLKLRNRYEGKSITTAELLRVFETEFPPSLSYEGHKSLDWFYQGWVNGTAIPRFRLQAVKFSDHANETSVSGTILQTDAPEDLVTSIPVYAVTSNKTLLLGRVFADGPETQFHFKAPSGTRKVLLDPEQTVLAKEK